MLLVSDWRRETLCESPERRANRSTGEVDNRDRFSTGAELGEQVMFEFSMSTLQTSWSRQQSILKLHFIIAFRKHEASSLCSFYIFIEWIKWRNFFHWNTPPEARKHVILQAGYPFQGHMLQRNLRTVTVLGLSSGSGQVSLGSTVLPLLCLVLGNYWNLNLRAKKR